MSDKTFPLAERQILLVEDDSDSRELVTFVLESAGATVIPVDSIAKALSALEQSKPDVILTDLTLPDGDGYSFIPAWRQREVERRIPFIPAIAMSGADKEVGEERALSGGFQHYISKPFSIKTIIDVVAEVISTRHPTNCAV